MTRAPFAALLFLAGCAAVPVPCCGDFTNARGKFVVCGDSRGWMTGEYWRKPTGFERRAVFERLAEENPDFILNTGDLVAVGSLPSQWEIFDVETAPIRAKGIAYLPALGNHDLWPSADEALANWSARFPFLEGRRWYEVRHGYVDLLVLDTNADLLDAAQIAEETAWYRARLAAAEADPDVRCTIVAMHHSPFTNSFLGGKSDWVRREFVEPAAAAKKVRAFVTGHVHSYEHFVRDGVHFVVSGGGGAPLMDVAGPAGEFADLYDGPRGHHFVRFTPRDDRIDVEVVMLAEDRTWFTADAFAIDLK